MPADFSVSREGISLSYRRFLSDSAAGFVVILLLCMSQHLQGGIFEHLHLSMMTSLSKEERIFILAVLFVLATPLGFVINAIGWFVLEQPTTILERFYFDWCQEGRGPFAVLQVSAVRYRVPVNRYFRLERANFATIAWFMRDVLEAYVPVRVEPHHHLRGLVIFMQNSAFLLLVFGFGSLVTEASRRDGSVYVVASAISLMVLLIGSWAAPNEPSRAGRVAFGALLGGMAVATGFYAMELADAFWTVVYFGGAFALMLLSAAVAFYQHAAILMEAYLVCREYQIDEASLPEHGSDRVFELATRLAARVHEIDVDVAERRARRDTCSHITRN